MNLLLLLILILLIYIVVKLSIIDEDDNPNSSYYIPFHPRRMWSGRHYQRRPRVKRYRRY